MKQALFLLLCLILSGIAFGQVNAADNPDHLKIILGKDSVQVSFNGKSLRLTSIQELDGWMKQNIAGLTPPEVDLVSVGELTPQKHRDLIVITDRYRCPVVSEKMVSDGKPKVAVRFRDKD